MRSLSFVEGLVLSICLHLLFVGAVLFYNLQFERKDNTVAVEFIDKTPPIRPETVKEKVNFRKEKHEVRANQIVEQEEKPSKDKKPDDARFLSAQNQKVEKQIVAKNKGEFKNIEKSSADKAKKVAGDPTKEIKKGAEKSKPTLSKLAPEFDPLAIKERQQMKQEQAEGRDFENADGGDVSQSSDYIKDVEQGSKTMLNTREFKYYTYYNRIRRQLSQHWEPKVREKLSRLFRQGRNIASDHDHITKLLIILNNEGVLVKVQVLGESGVRDLDDAAMEAFRSAAPFPNPPKGIVEADGTVKIHWDFVLES